MTPVNDNGTTPNAFQELAHKLVAHFYPIGTVLDDLVDHLAEPVRSCQTTRATAVQAFLVELDCQGG